MARISDGAKAHEGQRRWAGYHFYLFQGPNSSSTKPKQLTLYIVQKSLSSRFNYIGNSIAKGRRP
jgi:hypothetical protein